MRLEEKDYWTIDEFATYIGYSKSYVYKLTCKNQLPFHKFLGKVMFAREDIHRIIQEGLVKSNDQLTEELL